jgi:hypothetical protein
MRTHWLKEVGRATTFNEATRGVSTTKTDPKMTWSWQMVARFSRRLSNEAINIQEEAAGTESRGERPTAERSAKRPCHKRIAPHANGCNAAPRLRTKTEAWGVELL